MAIHLKGDSENIKKNVSSDYKALKMNLNQNIYGSFSEIGAGQETVRHFFRAGNSSGTIAKAMSAYDKDFSDAIYGREKDGRYVTEERLRKMMIHDITHLEERLDREKHPDKLFFSYSNTVATIDFAQKFKGHGWVGICFQVRPDGDYNEIILHLRFKQNNAKLQQETLGVLGINLIYGAFYLHDNPKNIITSLYDNIAKRDLEIDLINFSGECFENVSDQLMSLELLKRQMTKAIMFNKQGKNVLPAKELYKKNVLTLRGRFRPITKLNMDMYERSKELFFEKKSAEERKNTNTIFEISFSNLLTKENQVWDRDFLDRASLLCSLGQNVIITNFKSDYELAEYLSEFTKGKDIGMVIGVENLQQIFEPKYYTNLKGGILEAFGKLFSTKTRIYVYPCLDRKTNTIVNFENVKINKVTKQLYDFVKKTRSIVGVEKYNESVLNIFSKDVIEMIEKGEDGWIEKLPEGVATQIKKGKLFGFQ